jgi:hypothetical protein
MKMQANQRLNSVMYREENSGVPESGASSTPAATPSAGAGDVQSDDWGATDDDALDTPVVPDVPAAGGTPAVPATPAATPAPAATPPVVPAAAATVPAAPAEPATPAAIPTEAPAAPIVPVDIAVLRKNYENELTANYKLDPETAARLQTEPENVLPMLAARVHLDVLDAVMAQLPQRVGGMIQQFNTFSARERESEDAMFSAYPQLKAHKDSVLKVGQMFRQANPKATREQAIKYIGDFVMHSLGLTALAAAPAAPAVAPVLPFTPGTSGGAGDTPVAKGDWDFIDEDET